MYEDLYEQRIELERQLEDEELTLTSRRELSRKLRLLCKALGEQDLVEGEDPLIDKWEHELEQGITPDLDERP